ncbi:unnamed protein product [Adineta ricciae]|uniref:F-box domain-containing protein n=1 Tax=Adineta ricciae TaxID=249248 RepID=A0A815LD88_ADIRI|nr:unnamed protein product [Adineta ricciae]
MLTVSLLDFSVELLFEIFDNLDTQTILKTLRPICTKLYETAKAYHRYKVILSTSSISYTALVKHVIKPENITSLLLINSNRMQSDSSMSFSNLFQADTFIRLQELSHRVTQKTSQTVARYMDEKIIIRYDTSPSNGTYRLLTKDCSNSTQHTFLEKEFTLDSCTVTNAAAHILGAALKNNTTLSTVNLGNNKLVHSAMFLLNEIFNIKNLHTLRIRCDQFSVQHFAHLGSLLSRNTSLINFSVHKNQISFEGLRLLIVGLGFNETLETLIFEDIGIDGSPSSQSQPNGVIEDELAQYFAKILNVNKAMKTLVLPCVRHSAAGIQNLMDALKINTTLKCISLDAHGIDSRGTKFVADALKKTQY